MTFDDRRKQLLRDLEAFAWNNEAELFTEPKSQELNFGRIGFRLSKPTVEEIPPPAGEKKSPWSGVRDRIRATLVRWLGRLRLGAGKPDGTLFNVSVSPNKNALLAKFKSKAITDRQLAKLGLQFVAERNEFFHEIEAKEIQSHETAPAAGSGEAAAA